MSFFDCFVETILNIMVHIKLVVSKLWNEVFDYPQVSTNTGEVEGITIVLKEIVLNGIMYILTMFVFTNKQTGTFMYVTAYKPSIVNHYTYKVYNDGIQVSNACNIRVVKNWME